MGLTGNFGALTLHGDELTVVGSSSGLPGCDLVARNVAVQQDGIVHQGPANLEPTSWKTDVPLAAAGFKADPALQALALGSETYFNRRERRSRADLRDIHVVTDRLDRRGMTPEGAGATGRMSRAGSRDR